MPKAPFQQLLVWQKAMKLAVLAYKITASFPAYELYGLASQVRRAAVSVSSNIAEGSQRTTTRDFSYFLSVSKGSLAEIITQVLLAQRLGYVSATVSDQFTTDADEIGKMLFSLQRSLSQANKVRTDN